MKWINKLLSSKNVLIIMLGLILFCFTTYSVKAAEVGDVASYDYTGSIETFTAPETGYYRLEVWGASGGSVNTTYHGGYGGYATGVVLLRANQTVYVVVGGQGKGATAPGQSLAGGYNGGGDVAGNSGVNHMTGSGGGATHIATATGLLNSLSSDKESVLIVAGGGGGGRNQANHTPGGAKWGSGGHGGGYIAGAVISNHDDTTTMSATLAVSGTQTTGYAFGLGESATGTSAGGGGWYGGYSGLGVTGFHSGAGGGGSGYIASSLLSNNGVTKSMYCYNCPESTEDSTRTVTVTTYNATATSNQPKSGNGYAKITFLQLLNEDAHIENITLSHGKWNKTFDKDTFTYNITVDSEEPNLTISATPVHDATTIVGAGEHVLMPGDTEIIITATAESGDILTYTLNVTRAISNYPYLEDIRLGGVSIENFNPETLTYDINLAYDVEELDLEFIKARPAQTVILPDDMSVKTGENTIIVEVISEDGQNEVTYTLNIMKAHSNKLKFLSIEGYDITPEFDRDTYTYNVSIMASTMVLNVIATAYDEEATITLSGFGYIKSSKTATITVSEPNCEDMVYTIVIDKEDSVAETIYDFNYTGEIQEFTAPATGYYKLETWGAQGGSVNSTYYGGYGGYATGAIFLNSGQTIYIGVGGQGNGATGRGQSLAGGYNGGGDVTGDSTVNHMTGSGGGATHIATETGLLNTLSDNRNSVLIVAGGGGGGRNQANHVPGGAKWGSGGHGGGYIAGAVVSNHDNTTTMSATLAVSGTQTIGYAFGQGESATGTSAGGSGWYGGYSGQGITGFPAGAGGGGSGYIGNSDLVSYRTYIKSMYCYNCPTSTDEDTYTISTTNVSATPTSYYAKSGNGYARITLLPQPSENNYLTDLTVKTTNFETGEKLEKTYTPDYDMTVEDYYLTVDTAETKATIYATAEDAGATISGTGEVDVLAGENVYKIKVTAESGSVKEYRVHITREASTNPYPVNITINGLVASLCSVSDEYCVLNPENFEKDTLEYYLTVPNTIKQLTFIVDKAHPYQKVTGEGSYPLEAGENYITIQVESEDGSASKLYKYYVTRASVDASLINLEVKDPATDIGFSPSVTEYYLSVPNDYTNIKELVVEVSEGASYNIVGNEDFEIGMNQVSVIVTSDSGNIKIYTLNVYREASGNTYISSLEVRNGDIVYELTPTFNKIYPGKYQVTVPNDVEEVEIVATAELEGTTILNAGTKTLNPGNNQLSVIAMAQDGSMGTYTINIYREKNNNTNLISLGVKGNDKEYALDPSYDNSILEYEVLVDEDVETVEITAEVEASGATYQLLDNSSIKSGDNIKRVLVIAEDGTTKIITINVIKPVDANNYLTSLIVKNSDTEYVLTPPFDKDTMEYTLEVENNVTSVEILATKESETAKVSGLGTYALTVGINEIAVLVEALNGDVRTYNIEITRKESSNAYLSSITSSVGTITPEFNKETLKYTINVEDTVDEITIGASVEVETTTVTGTGTYSLESGSNVIELVTLAKDGITSLPYTIDVVKDKSTNDNIDILIMKEGILAPDFDANIISYTVDVPNEVTKGTFIVELEDDKADYEIIGNENFEVGENEVIIRVTSEVGLSKDYTVIVNRQEVETSSNYLSSITTSTGELTPEFTKENQFYEVSVPYEVTSIIVNATTEDDKAKLTGDGLYLLNVGKNVVGLKVVGTDGKVRDYQVLVTREKNTEARLSALAVSGAALSPTFNKDTYEYNLTTSNNVLTFLKIETLDSNATYEVIGNEALSVGVNTVTIRVTAHDGKTTKDYILNVTKTVSENNNLSSLSVDGFEISPEFNKATTLYNLTVDNSVNSILINATAEDEKATLIGDGVQYLSIGDNYFDVEVTSESGKSKVYTLVITKVGSSNNNISNLIVNNGEMTPDFVSTTITYDVVVPYEEVSLDLTVILEDENATYSVVGNNLEVGTNTVNVVVTAEDGSIKTYTLNVTREEINSALLDDLKVKYYELSPNFNSHILTYDLLIDNEVDSLDLIVIPMDENATYEVYGNESLVEGLNVITIEVTASDGVTKETYTLNVNKQAYGNSFLEYLYTSEGDVTPMFEKEVLAYTINVPSDVEEIELFGEASDVTATVTGLGVRTINAGENKIPITVTTTAGIKRTYYVTVIKDKSNDNYLGSLEAEVGTTVYELSPEFEKNTLVYKVTVPVGTTSISLSGTVESDNATATGFGIHMLNVGENKLEINVTSESGNVRTYTVLVTREASDNNYLIDLVPSVGSLEPYFNYYDFKYTIKLDSSVSTLSFTYITEDASAKVTGWEDQLVPTGTSVRNIVVTAENGSEKIYEITIIKEDNSEARLEELRLENYPFVFDSDTFIYNVSVSGAKKELLASEIMAIPKDEDATVNLMGDIKLSEGIINVYTIEVIAKDGYTTQKYILNITRDSELHTLRSEVHEIIRDDEEDYVTKIEIGVTRGEFFDNYLNDNEYLKLYDKDGQEITEDDRIATGDVIKLEIDGIIYDSLRVIVLGDVTGDGKVDVSDSVDLNNVILKKKIFEGYIFKAGDVTSDGKIDVSDSVKLNNYILKKIASLVNEES